MLMNSFKLPTNQVDLTNCTAAYSLRVVNISYSGPTVDVRRSLDNTTCTVYTDYNRRVIKIYTTDYDIGSSSFSNWASGSASLYVTRLYDQTGNGRHLDSSGSTPTRVLNFPKTTAALDSIIYDGNSNIERVDSSGTNLPLTIGDDTYTLVCVHRLTAKYNLQDMFSITNTSLLARTRASMIANTDNTWGFVGHGNDIISFSSLSTNSMCRALLCVNNANTVNIRAVLNGTLSSGTSSNRTGAVGILRSHITSLGGCGSGYAAAIPNEFTTGYIYEAFIFNVDVAADSTKLTDLNYVLQKMYP